MVRPSIISCYSLLVLLFLGGTARASDIPDSQYYPATGPTRSVALLLLGGSEGGLPDYYDTKGLTAEGYACLVVGYFGTRTTPERLELIPLEYFEEVIQKFRAQPEIAGKKLVVWGGSKGGELALLLASRYRDIEGVIAAVPSAVVFQGIGGRRVSSWAYHGEPLPFVPYADYDWSRIVNNQYLEVYRLSLEQTEAVKAAAIKVENIHGPVLILTGQADTMWPSSQMGDMIMQRLTEHRFSHWYRHYSYADAGHTLNDGYRMGGTVDGNRKAKEDAALRISEFLRDLADKKLHSEP